MSQLGQIFSSSGSGVISLNSITGAVVLTEGENIIITPAGQDISIATSDNPTFTSVTSNSFLTGTITTPDYMTINGNTISVDGTNANVDLNFATKGSGCWVYQGISTGYANSMWHMCQASIQTTNATATTLVSIPLLNGEMVIANVTINGFDADFTNALGANVSISAFRPAAGNIQQMGEETINVNCTTTANVTAGVNTATESVIIEVIGIAAQTWNWVATYQYMFTTTN